MRIFVSYKRLDKEKVFRLVDTISQKTGQECWIDLTGIESDKQFVDVIIKAINKAEIVLFMYSARHLEITDYEQDWTVRELDFAADKGKRIVFVNLDRSKLSDWFLFNFGRKEQVFADDPASIDRLCQDICQWLGCSKPVTSQVKSTEIQYVPIDLGLPSGIKWMDRNIGASRPEDFGNYYAWGELTAKNSYSWNNYRFRMAGDTQENVTVSKYNTRSRRGPVDNKLVLDLADDAAAVQIPKGGRMPTIEEWHELFENCNIKWEEKGFRFTSKINGNSIFLPAAGYVGGFPSPDSLCGYYWSATLDNYDPAYAWMVFFESGVCKVNKGDRYTGFSIRAVQDAVFPVDTRSVYK